MRGKAKIQFCVQILVISFVAALLAPMAIYAQSEEKGQVTETPERVSVHDPSIIKADGTYYVFGSHMADAKSNDLIDWTQINRDWNNRETVDAWKKDSIYGEVVSNFRESFRWAGYNDGDCKNDGLAVWAPDVKYNPYYEWPDGQTGAYMMYYSASSTWRRSCIGYAVAKSIEGPYEYVDTVIYSGFTKVPGTDGSRRDTKWDNDYLNLKQLLTDGTLTEISDNWFDKNGGWNHAYAPNAIDPTLFFDTENNLYMIYGSWSGGLWILELDRTSGAAKYPGEDGTEPVSGNTRDRYFGTRIAGGNGQSGEGPYILYDKETQYYYLYETYAGLSAKGGYNMRLFRSKNVYGPYVDAKGQNARESWRRNENYGIKLIGNYQFSGQPGYRSAGHNSAFMEEDGSRYLIYHQRFDQPGKQTEYHEVRVRQQFLNEEGWPVAAVYENRGEKIGHYERLDVTGSYEIVNHGTGSGGGMLTSQKIALWEDGTVTGDMSGTWEKTTGEGREYDYITMTVGDTVYRGYFFEQYNEKETPEKVMTFSAMGNDNTCLWGTHRTKEEEETDPVPRETQTPIVSPEPTQSASPVTVPTAVPTGQQTAVPAVTPTASPARIQNQTVSVKKITYQVTDADRREVMVVKALDKADVVIPDTVKINGIRCKVTAIGKNAFAKKRNLRTVTIGRNVTKIGERAFFRAKKLKKVKIKSITLKSVGVGAFQGIQSKAVFQLPKKKKSVYRKLLSKKTGITRTMSIG